jgi:hypothetical protein
MPSDQRQSPRVPIDCPLTLVRRHGAAVGGHTLDIGPGGARVVVDRPLSIDEELEFDLVLDDVHVDGRARVLRQQSPTRYALRFEGLGEEAWHRLAAAARTA